MFICNANSLAYDTLKPFDFLKNYVFNFLRFNWVIDTYGKTSSTFKDSRPFKIKI